MAPAMATLPALTSFKGVSQGQYLSVHNIQIEYPETLLAEGMNFLRSAIFPVSSTKMHSFGLLCNLAGCVLSSLQLLLLMQNSREIVAITPEVGESSVPTICTADCSVVFSTFTPENTLKSLNPMDCSVSRHEICSPDSVIHP